MLLVVLTGIVILAVLNLAHVVKQQAIIHQLRTENQFLADRAERWRLAAERAAQKPAIMQFKREWRRQG